MFRSRLPTCSLLFAASVALAALACGEDNASGPGGPPVSVAIDPAEVDLKLGEARTLVASYFDADGRAATVPADWTQVWSSSDPSVVAVEAGGIVRAQRLGSAELSLAAGAPGGTQLKDKAPVRVLAPVAQPATDRKSSATVGPEGGSVTAQGADGTRYVLTVPPGALVEPVEIALTPLDAIDNLPLGGALAGAVDFSPDGLRFRIPAELQLIATEKVELRGLAAFGLRDGDLRLEPLQLGGNTIKLMVGHFSGAGAAEGDAEELAMLAALPGGTPEEQALQAIGKHNWDAAMAGEDPDPAVHAELLDTWFEDGVKPAMEAAASDPTKLEDALAQFVRWDLQRSLWADRWLEAEVEEARGLAVDMLAAEIERLNNLCSTQNDAGPVTEILNWSGLAILLGLATPENGLTVDSVVQNLCLQVQIVETTFPEEIDADATETLTVRAGVSIGGRAPSFATPLELSLDGGNFARVVPSSGETDGSGNFSAQVSLVDGSSEARITIVAAYPGIPQVEAKKELSALGTVSLSLVGRPSGTDPTADAKEVELDPGGVARLTVLARQGRGGYLRTPVTLSVDGGGTLSATEVRVDSTDGTATFSYTAPSGTGEATIRARVVEAGLDLEDSVVVRYSHFEPVDLALDFQTTEPDPTITGPLLRSGREYLITVSGTYSVWTSEWEDGICRGSPAAGVGGPTGFDAEARFSVPVGSVLCQEQYECCPAHTSKFTVSLDGGSSFEHYHPGAAPNYLPGEKLAQYSASHIYRYRLAGQGHEVVFMIEENDNRSDDYGVLEIHIESAPPLE